MFSASRIGTPDESRVPSVRAKPHRTALHGAAMKGCAAGVGLIERDDIDLDVLGIIPAAVPHSP